MYFRLRICTSRSFRNVNPCYDGGSGACQNVNVLFKDGVKSVYLYFCTSPEGYHYCAYATSTSGNGYGTMMYDDDGNCK